MLSNAIEIIHAAMGLLSDRVFVENLNRVGLIGMHTLYMHMAGLLDGSLQRSPIYPLAGWERYPLPNPPRDLTSSRPEAAALYIPFLRHCGINFGTDVWWSHVRHMKKKSIIQL